MENKQKTILLAENVGNLQYDLTSKVIDDFAELFIKNSKKYPEKSDEYISAAICMKSAKNYINKAWTICENHKESCSVHPRAIKGRNLNNIASNVFLKGETGNFLEGLASDLWSQAYCDDTVRKRAILSSNLYSASEKLDEAAEFINKIFHKEKSYS